VHNRNTDSRRLRICSGLADVRAIAQDLRLLIDNQAAVGWGLRRKVLSSLRRSFGHLLRRSLWSRDRLGCPTTDRRSAVAAAAIVAATAFIAAMAVEETAQPFAPARSTTFVASRLSFALGRGFAATAFIAMEQAAEAFTPALVATFVAGFALGCGLAAFFLFAAFIAVETATQAFKEARALLTRVATAATICGRRRGQRLGSRRRCVSAREPGRRYQQESSIHDCTSVGENLRPEGRGCGVERFPPWKAWGPHWFQSSIKSVQPRSTPGALRFAGLWILVSAPNPSVL
jgi:hypothetical protein